MNLVLRAFCIRYDPAVALGEKPTVIDIGEFLMQNRAPPAQARMYADLQLIPIAGTQLSNNCGGFTFGQLNRQSEILGLRSIQIAVNSGRSSSA